MTFRIWKNIMFLLVAAYGAYDVLMDKPCAFRSWQYYFYLICPWVLLFGSLKAWHRSFTWRCMVAKKNISPKLSRGRHQPSTSRQYPSILEYASLSLFLMAVTAILKQFEVANIPWWIGSTIGSYFLLRLIIGMVR